MEVELICEVCGKNFFRKKVKAKNYCSLKCVGLACWASRIKLTLYYKHSNVCI